MHRLTRHLRGLLVALAALALTAGVVLAARPTSVDAPPAAAADGLSTATEASGQTVPVRAGDAALPEADEDAAPDLADPEADEDEGADDAGDRPQNHGWFVSQAAKGATPASAANHGESVSAVARSDAGKPAAAIGAAAAARSKAKGPKTGTD